MGRTPRRPALPEAATAAEPESPLARQLRDLEAQLEQLDPESVEHRDALRTCERWRAELAGP